jgi:C4-dicarboxylate-specific signal transduction histidine kinase
MRERGLALAEAQRLASAAELAAALAHDLSQPLSAIGTYASASQVLAGRGAQDHPKLLETLGQITKETARAGQYLRRMRDFFQTGTMREESVKVVELIEAARIHIEDRLTRAHIHWRATLDGPLPPVRVDVVQMGAVLGNLVGNACDALGTHDGPREIHVQAQMVPGTKPTLVRVRIEDSGPGIAPELRERLFLPLATTKPNGMGLGLALSRSIAERQGGHLWYDDSRERTSFCLDLRTDA